MWITLIKISRLNLDILCDRINTMEQPQFIKNEIYHVYNRGVEKRNIFLNDKDRFRFIHNLFELNDEKPCVNSNYCLSPKNIEVQPRYSAEREPRKLLVNILAFCLMPNHFHLLLSQKKEYGITKFMQKFGTGYTMYFNKKHDRVGHLFQGRFKAIHANRQEYLEYLLYYIHLNALDSIEPGWRQGKIKNYAKALKFLKSYRWSSHPDYIGKKNFPSVTQREFLLRIVGREKNYEASIKEWLNKMGEEYNDEEFETIALE